ncbi:hypothetical protein [Mariniluteicoccus flavus]
MAAADAEHAQAQLAWLSNVLTARGMPRILTEDHLFVLADALEAERPGDEVPAVLRQAGAMLRTRRTEQIDEETYAALVAGFESAVAGDPTAVANCGPLIVSAVCDEDDIATSVGALADWLGDPERFSKTWVAAVEETLEGAYAAKGQTC